MEGADVKRLIASSIDWLVRHRSALPAWVDRLMISAARNPDGLAGRLATALLGSGSAPIARAPEADVRVLIAPTNYSGQGYLWARALEAAAPDVGARNLAVSLPGGYDFPADTLVPIATVNSSSDWAEEQWQAARLFTHVLVEAERSLLGRRFGRSLPEEIAALESAGVSVAFLAHGTDIRDPDRHAQRTPWSPYPEDPRTEQLRADARENLALLERLPHPTFVSTPDLLDDLPGATWCPVVVDADAFAAPVAPFGRERPLVVHASSSPVQKGSHYIEPAIAGLVTTGIVDYRLVTGVATNEMPGIFARADIVIDQFRLGSYGVAACEAMAAGRIVIGHVLPSVRAHVRAATGRDLPIVEATPETLVDVIRELVSDPDAARVIAARGPAFVKAVHSGSASARALLDGWIRRD